MELIRYSFTWRDDVITVFAINAEDADAIMATLLIRGNTDPDKKVNYNEVKSEYTYFQI